MMGLWLEGFCYWLIDDSKINTHEPMHNTVLVNEPAGLISDGNQLQLRERMLPPDVYVTKLPSYLKEDPSLEIITIKGIGYRFATGL